MTNKRISIFVMTALVAALAIFVATATADEHSGTWKLNPAKSKYSPGPAPKNLTRIRKLRGTVPFQSVRLKSLGASLRRNRTVRLKTASLWASSPS
jgi:hypothetical protein